MSAINNQQVRDAFRQAGLYNNGQLDRAETITNRINDLAKMRPEGRFDVVAKERTYSPEQRSAIGNLLGLIRTRIFDQPADDKAVHRANDIVYSALKELGVADKLQHATASSLNRLKFDVNHFAYAAMVKDVAGLAGYRSEARAAAQAEGLDIVSMSWDDPSRVGTNSPWGSNIIDSSLTVEMADAKTGEVNGALMPIVRQPNLEDVTADVDMDSFMINVGNARGEPLRQISLKEALQKPWELMTDPEKWPLRDGNGAKVGVYAAGTDSQALVAAQSSLLPVSKEGGHATFTPSAFSYTSFDHPDHGPQPTVMTLMVTREGTSMEILGDDGDKIGFGADRLHFNENGKRAPLTAERAAQSDVAVDTSGNGQGNADQANRILFIQIPLIPEHPRPASPFGGAVLETVAFAPRGGPDLDDAVIGHGPTEGPYNEEMGKGWKRNPDVPVRVTVQFAKTLSDPKSLDAAALKGIRAEIDAVYENASRVGSLVMTGDGPSNPPWIPGPVPMPPVIPFGDS